MPNSYRIINIFELEDAIRESTDVIEVFPGKEFIVHFRNDDAPRIITGPATVVADIQSFMDDGISAYCIRQLILAAPEDLIWDGHACAVNDAIRRRMLNAFLTNIYPEFPAVPPQNIEGTYIIRASGGFVPLIPKGWRAVQINRHLSKWVILSESDERIKHDAIEGRVPYEVQTL